MKVGQNDNRTTSTTRTLYLDCGLLTAPDHDTLNVAVANADGVTSHDEAVNMLRSSPSASTHGCNGTSVRYPTMSDGLATSRATDTTCESIMGYAST